MSPKQLAIARPKRELPVHIRWMIRRDMSEVLRIENGCFEFPWSEQDFVWCLRQRNCIGMVAEARFKKNGEVTDAVLGFMVYELYKEQLHILNFAVHPKAQRRSVGSTMAAKLASKLSHQRRNRIMVEVRETNLTAQLFFREMGFRAVTVLKDFYIDTDEDAYLMQYQYQPQTHHHSATVKLAS